MIMLRLNDCNDYLVNMLVNDFMIIYWMPVCRCQGDVIMVQSAYAKSRQKLPAIPIRVCSCKCCPTALSGYSVNEYDFVTYFTNINKVIEKDCVEVMLNCLP